MAVADSSWDNVENRTFGKRVLPGRQTDHALITAVTFTTATDLPSTELAEEMALRLAYFHTWGNIEHPSGAPETDFFVHAHSADNETSGSTVPHAIWFGRYVSFGDGGRIHDWQLDHIEQAVTRMMRASEIRDDRWEVDHTSVRSLVSHATD